MKSKVLELNASDERGIQVMVAYNYISHYTVRAENFAVIKFRVLFLAPLNSNVCGYLFLRYSLLYVACTVDRWAYQANIAMCLVFTYEYNIKMHTCMWLIKTTPTNYAYFSDKLLSSRSMWVLMLTLRAYNLS